MERLCRADARGETKSWDYTGHGGAAHFRTVFHKDCQTLDHATTVIQESTKGLVEMFLAAKLAVLAFGRQTYGMRLYSALAKLGLLVNAQ